PGADLDVFAFFSDATLVPPANLQLGGLDNDRTLTIMPAPNRLGTGVVSIVVRDPEGLSGTNSFLLAVKLPNRLPTISTIPNQMIPEDTTAASIPFTVGDIETPAVDLVVSGYSSDLVLVPVGNITIGGSGSDRFVSVKPTTNLSGTVT